MIDRIASTIDKYKLVDKGEGVVVGLSGGPDSVCLLHALTLLSGQYGIQIYAVHVNHMLRGDEADRDEAYVKELCNRLNIPIKVEHCDIRQKAKDAGISIEEAGREARYEAFEEYLKYTGATKIAVAHNKNDQAETVLMRMLRGTGLDGLKGMEHKRGNIIRPLLDADRKDIEKYCEDNRLNPITDSSNLKNIYTRNKVRIDLIPYINNLFDVDIVQNLYNMSILLRDDHEFIAQSLTKLYNYCVVNALTGKVVINVNKLLECPQGAQKRILRKAALEVKGNIKGLESKHVDMMLDLAKEGRTGAVVQLPGKLRVERNYSTICVFVEKPGYEKKKDHLDTGSLDISVVVPGSIYIKELDAVIISYLIPESDSCKERLKEDDSRYIQFFDYEKLKSGINIRNRKPGDIIKPFGSTGSKKLKEFFIDEKIPREQRGKIPLLAVGNEIVWLIGYRSSDKFKISENTKHVLKIEYRPKIMDRQSSQL